jgi:hypothetical protein
MGMAARILDAVGRPDPGSDGEARRMVASVWIPVAALLGFGLGGWFWTWFEREHRDLRRRR